MTTPTKFRATGKYRSAQEKKANTRPLIFANCGDGSAGAGNPATVASRPGGQWFWIRLVDDDNRVTQCLSPIPLNEDDLIYVRRAQDRNLSYYEFAEFIEDSGGGTVPPVTPHSLLGPGHDDTLTDAPSLGSIIKGVAGPDWDELVVGAARQLLQVNAGGTDFSWLAFDWDNMAAAAGADMVHDHSAAGEGGQNLRLIQELDFATATILTIDAAGTITRTQVYHIVAANAGVADNLDQIDGGGPGRDLLVIKPDTGDTITVRHNAGGAGDNIWLAGGADIVLNNDDHLALFWDGTWWCDLSGGAAAGGNTLDQAYDQGGAGAGRTITVDTGAVQMQSPNATQHALEGQREDNATNTVLEVLRLIRRVSAGVGAVGLGLQILGRGEDNAGAETDMAAIEMALEDVGPGTLNSHIRFLDRVGGGALAEAGRIKSHGAEFQRLAVGALIGPPVSVGEFKNEGTTEPLTWSKVTSAKTNSVVEVLRTIAISAGAALAGFGVRHLFKLEDGAGNEDDAGAIDAVWDDPSSGSEDSRLQFSLRIGGAALAEVCRLDETGAVLPSGFDVYPEGDGGGLFQRAPNHWRVPDDHFNAFAGWAWAVDPPFDGAPDTIDVTTYPSLLRLANLDLTEDHFAWQACTDVTFDLYCRMTKQTDSYIGIRIDGGDDNDYVEVRLVDSVANPGMFRLHTRNRLGGGAVTNTYTNDPLPPAFYVLSLRFNSVLNAVYVSVTEDAPEAVYTGVSAAFTDVPSRVGIIFGHRVHPLRIALVDWYEYTT